MTQARMNTIQIATFGSEGQDAIASGIRNFPVHKLALICFESDKEKANEFSTKIKSIVGLPYSIHLVSRKNVIKDTLERVSEILAGDGKDFSQVLINVSCGDKLIGCAALSAAFINGIKAFGMDETDSPLLMPILKLSYNEIISESKMKILKAIDQAADGFVQSLEHLEAISGYGKPLLSYHIQGARESKGLADLGLLEIEKGERGKISARLTTLGKLLVVGTPPPSTPHNQHQHHPQQHAKNNENINK
jgi:hypothetical protein